MARTAQPQRRAQTPRRTTTTTTRTRSVPRRRQPQPTGAKKVLGTLTSALPIGAATKKVKRPGGKSGGPSKGLLVLGAGAAAAALKNRQKLQSKLPGKAGRKAQVVAPADTAGTPHGAMPVTPATPVQ